eukprot:gene8190-8381_t
MATADVVLLGEYHDDPVAHALQLELLKRVSQHLGYAIPSVNKQPQQSQTSTQPSQQHQQQQQGQEEQQQQTLKRPLILTLEMFERDVQQVLDEYICGAIRLSDLMKDSRPWPNFNQDYLPLVELCKALQLPVIAANAPRRRVQLRARRAMVQTIDMASSRQYGVMSLGTTRLTVIFGLIDLQWLILRVAVGFDVSSNFLDAQTLWDASMAHAIAQALRRHPPASPEGQQQQAVQRGVSGADADAEAVEVVRRDDHEEDRPLVLHVCGKFHCEHRLGIPEQLQMYLDRPVVVLVVVFIPAELQPGKHMTPEDFQAAQLQGSADFIVLTDASLPRSFSSQHPV